MLDSFGSCYGLVRRVLRQILVLRTINESNPLNDVVDDFGAWLYGRYEFWHLFYAAMPGPPPPEIERELDVLFSCANTTLLDARPFVDRYLQESTGEDYSQNLREYNSIVFWKKISI